MVAQIVPLVMMNSTVIMVCVPETAHVKTMHSGVHIQTWAGTVLFDFLGNFQLKNDIFQHSSSYPNSVILQGMYKIKMNLNFNVHSDCYRLYISCKNNVGKGLNYQTEHTIALPGAGSEVT